MVSPWQALSHEFWRIMSDTELSSFLAATGDAGYDWDLGSDRLHWFGATARLFGAAKPPASGAQFKDLILTEDRPHALNAEGDTLDRRYRIDCAGAPLWVQDRGTLVRDGKTATRRRGILRPVEAPRQDIRSSNAPGRDGLTGCFDRGYMLTLLARAREAVAARKRPAAYLVIGIDKMSFVNEAVGMEAGDALICGVAERLQRLMPPRSALARVGGDMFGLLLPEPIDNELARLVAHILQDFRDHPVVTSVTPLHITVSIGGIRLELPPESGETALNAGPGSSVRSATEAMIFAEQALHDAQLRGRNLFMEYLDSPARALEHRQLLELGERIKHAFKHDGFRLAYQPVVDTGSGKTLFFEALVRMFCDDGTPIPAAKFVPAIEQLGLAFELDRLVLDLAVTELAGAPDLHLAINVSGLTASQADWPEHVRRILAGKADVARRLIVEITETAAIVDIGATKLFIETLRELGGQVAMDDFGVGFTSLSYLRTLSLSIMKIDKALLTNLLTQGDQQHLVRMLIRLAQGLGIKTVAEGVETEDVAAWMRGEQVDMMQGYFFGKPSLERSWTSSAQLPAAVVPRRVAAK